MSEIDDDWIDAPHIGSDYQIQMSPSTNKTRWRPYSGEGDWNYGEPPTSYKGAGELSTTTSTHHYTGGEGRMVNYNLMSNLQYEAVFKWGKANGRFHVHPKYTALKALEEMVELCIESGATQSDISQVLYDVVRTEAIRGKNFGVYNYAEMTKEFGDVTVCLAAYAEDCQINTTEAIGSTLDRIASRTWTPDVNGILRRPKVR